jgi:hypothetical protein
LQSVTQTDPGATAIYEQNLGVVLDLSQTRDGVRLTLERVYADVNRVMLTYEVQTARTGTLFDGFATPTGEPLVTDSRGDVLPGYDASFQTDPRSNESVGIVVYDAASAAVNTGRLSLNIAVPGLRMRSNDGGTSSAGPFAFELTVPMSSGQSITVGETDTVRGVAVALDRVVASPSETRIYLTSSVGFKSAEPYLVAHITGPGYDSRTAVITTPAELVDLGSTFRAPDGEEVVTFNNTLFGKRGRFTLTVDSIGSGTRVVGPWVFSFVVP